MAIQIDCTQERMTVWIRGEVDHHAAAAMRSRIDRVTASSRPPLLRLDFREVTFMDSSGIGLIMGRYRAVQSYGGALELSGVSDRLRRLMSMAGLDRLAIRWVEAEQATPTPATRR